MSEEATVSMNALAVQKHQLPTLYQSRQPKAPSEIIKQEPDLLGNCFHAQIVSPPTANAFFDDKIQTKKFSIDYTHHVDETPLSNEHHFFSSS
nr:transcription factor MYB44-like [Ipomoea batatas]